MLSAFSAFYDNLIQTGVPEKQIITIALDDDIFVKYRNPDELSEYIRGKIVNSKMYYILIDEVQYSITKEELKNPENIHLYNVLNGLMRLRNVDIYVTGSNSKVLIKDVLTVFRGRGEEVRVYPVSFKEYYAFTGGDKSDATIANYLNYLIESFMFSNAKRYDVKGKKYFEYPSKYYCTDIGLPAWGPGSRKKHILWKMSSITSFCAVIIRSMWELWRLLKVSEEQEQNNSARLIL